ncbi:MinD/ParA family ATP-binding protein [Halorientalis salina]|uniref:MinD/ParA family ATP-binding protein n=1 Tax=Halorientalis salina TaxID=2932266 RepID=UPI0010ABEB6D|nr:P-loop NTPase [Halorientalis salina]
MLAIAGGKGGCGKTTTAVGLAAALAREGQSPLVADADHEMPDLHLRTDVPRQPGLDAVAGGARPATIAHAPSDQPDIAVVPAGIGPDAAPAGLDRLDQWSGPVLLDCPAGAARDAAVPLRVADRTLLVTNPEPQTIRDTAKTAAMARTLGAPPIGVVWIDRSVAGRATETTVSEEAARKLFGCGVCTRVPAASEPVLQVENVRTAYQAAARKVRKRNI